MEEENQNGEIETQEEEVLQEVDGKNKKELGYTADIKYQEDYITDYTHYEQSNNESTIDNNQGNVDDDDFMQMVHDDIKDLIRLVPKLPTNVQTAINQVLKPVIRAWKKIKDYEYPRHISDDEDPHIIIPPSPSTTPDSWNPDSWGPDSSTPDTLIPDSSTPDSWEPNPWDPDSPTWTPPVRENPDPTIIVPTITNPIPEPREDSEPSNTILSNSIVTDDDLFSPATDRRVEYETVDEVEKMKMEYTKNLAEVIHHYTSNLKDLVLEFFMNKISALSSATDEQDVSFITNEITENNCSTSDQLRHLMDAALRNEVIGTNKLYFSLNTFSLESTLYHLKNFNAVQELRLRYAEIEKLENNEMVDSTSNNILNGVRDMYDKKYDLAYINLYKYLNGSLNILEDCLRTMEASTKSRETLIRKDGLNK